ncbi:MAG TPA: nuclear transport factor 2 family protein [bacterium]|nr:nuclear transport factor 2 family protein [bacterium]
MVPKDIAEQWLVRFQDCVRKQDYASARELFDPDVLGYGSRVHAVAGQRGLEAEQWSRVWPNIEGFTFQLDAMRVHGEAAHGVLSIAVPWTSTGIAPDQGRFERPGRSTLILRLKGGDRWHCVHSHFSLLPGVPNVLR